MKEIQRWQDMMEFESRLVAFTMEKPIFYFDGSVKRGRGGDCFQFPDLPGIRFAFVSTSAFEWQRRYPNEGDCMAYEFTRIKYPDGVSGACALLDYFLEGTGLQVRLATDEERQRLKAAIDAGEAQLEYTDWEYKTKWEKIPQ